MLLIGDEPAVVLFGWHLSGACGYLCEVLAEQRLEGFCLQLLSAMLHVGNKTEEVGVEMWFWIPFSSLHKATLRTPCTYVPPITRELY